MYVHGIWFTCIIAQILVLSFCYMYMYVIVMQSLCICTSEYGNDHYASLHKNSFPFSTKI